MGVGRQMGMGREKGIRDVDENGDGYEIDYKEVVGDEAGVQGGNRTGNGERKVRMGIGAGIRMEIGDGDENVKGDRDGEADGDLRRGW